MTEALSTVQCMLDRVASHCTTRGLLLRGQLDLLTVASRSSCDYEFEAPVSYNDRGIRPRGHSNQRFRNTVLHCGLISSIVSQPTRVVVHISKGWVKSGIPTL